MHLQNQSNNLSHIRQSELILNPDGSVYHLNLKPEDVAPTVILVGDPARVSMVSKYFDEVFMRKSKREFVTHTGRIGNRLLTVLSTGIGTDNVDIVINELDALFNVDLETRVARETITQLTFIRIGTSGAIQEDLPVDSIALSRYGLGLDAMARLEISNADAASQSWYDALLQIAEEKQVHVLPAYMTIPDPMLVEDFKEIGSHWITVTCAGFYGLQGRSIRLKSTTSALFGMLSQFEHGGLRAGNLEMETAAIYLLSSMLGHRALSLNAVIANRLEGKFSKNPKAVVDTLIREALKILCS